MVHPGRPAVASPIFYVSLLLVLAAEVFEYRKATAAEDH